MRFAHRTLAVATALVVSSVLAGTVASAGPRGLTLGDPQPELAPFSFGAAAGGAGSAVALPDGTIVVVTMSPAGKAAVVCTLAPGARGCGSTATLSPYMGRGKPDSFSGVPEVLSTGGTGVAVVVEDCCFIPGFQGVGGAVVFNSINDGKTFSGEIPAGVIRGVDAATFASGQVVVASSETTSLNLQALASPPHVTVSPPVHPNNSGDGDTALSTYDGGVVVASDDAHGSTLVEYARAGHNLNLTSSYHSVAVFGGEDLAGVSGNALLTYSSTSVPGAFLRFFNGKSFGPAHKVPEPVNGSGYQWSLEMAGGAAHVFFLNRLQASTIYAESTHDGLHWSAPSIYASAATAGALVPALAQSGAGLVFETDVSAPPLMAQPVLNYQSVVIKLDRLRAPIGKRTTLNGQALPALPGQAVTLERRVLAGQWSNISRTHESAKAQFSFTVPGLTDAYRVVVAYEPGSYLYGYSNTVLLTAVVPPKS